MGLILGGFDLLLLGFGANPFLWLAFGLIGFGGAFGLTLVRGRGLRCALLTLWMPLPFIAGASFAAPCMLTPHAESGACYGEGMALVLSVAVSFAWAAGAGIGILVGARRSRGVGYRAETKQGS
jgi:hypothetical protein